MFCVWRRVLKSVLSSGSGSLDSFLRKSIMNMLVAHLPSFILESVCRKVLEIIPITQIHRNKFSTIQFLANGALRSASKQAVITRYV